MTNHVYDKQYRLSLSAVFGYLFNRTGPHTTTGCDHGAFVSTKASGAQSVQSMEQGAVGRGGVQRGCSVRGGHWRPPKQALGLAGGH